MSDIIKVMNGFAFKSEKYVNEGIRVIRITNVQDGYISDGAPKFYPMDSYEEVKEFILESGDLLMSLTGNVGRVGILKDHFLPAALNQRVACLRPVSNEVSIKYLFFYFQTLNFQKDCIASGKGMAQINISTQWLKEYAIALPPKKEQERITEAINTIWSVLDLIGSYSI